MVGSARRELGRRWGRLLLGGVEARREGRNACAPYDAGSGLAISGLPRLPRSAKLRARRAAPGRGVAVRKPSHPLALLACLALLPLRAFADDPAYESAWTLAQTHVRNSAHCRANRDANSQPLPWDAVALPGIRMACGLKRQAIADLLVIRDWPKPPPDSRTLDATLQAAEAAEDVLNARGSFPPGDPQFLPAAQVPFVPTSRAQDTADAEACGARVGASKGQLKKCSVTALPLDPEVVAWLHLVDAFLAIAPPQSPPDPYTAYADPAEAPKPAFGDLHPPQPLAYRAARVLFKTRTFGQLLPLTDAKAAKAFLPLRDRLWALLVQDKQPEWALQAYELLLCTYLIEQDFEGLQSLR